MAKSFTCPTHPKAKETDRLVQYGITQYAQGPGLSKAVLEQEIRCSVDSEKFLSKRPDAKGLQGVIAITGHGLNRI